VSPRPGPESPAEDATAALEQAVAALAQATDSVRTARRGVTTAVVTAYRAGMPLHQIAEHADTTPTALRNLLDAVGEPRHRR
jgi:ribosome recycling factor